MALRTFCAVLYSIIALIGSANASPITVYYDPAAWLAAINTFGPVTLGPYSGGVTVTDIITTAKTDSSGGCCEIIDRTSIDSFADINNLFWRITQLGDAVDAYCWAIPNCEVSAPTERIIHLDPGIVGFYSLAAAISLGGEINGAPIADPVFGQFLGVVGPTAVLDFSSGCEICDTLGSISLKNVQFAISVSSIAEPSAFACVVSSFSILVISVARFKRRDNKGVVRRDTPSGSPASNGYH